MNGVCSTAILVYQRVSGISHFAAASENDLLGPMFFRTQLGKKYQHMHWFRDPPATRVRSFNTPKNVLI